MKLTSMYLVMGLTLLFSCKEKGSIKKQVKRDLLFEDNFDKITLSNKTWNYDLGDGCPNLCGWGNNERQIYTKENVAVKNGKLVIKATQKDSTYYS